MDRVKIPPCCRLDRVKNSFAYLVHTIARAGVMDRRLDRVMDRRLDRVMDRIKSRHKKAARRRRLITALCTVLKLYRLRDPAESIKRIMVNHRTVPTIATAQVTIFSLVETAAQSSKSLFSFFICIN